MEDGRRGNTGSPDGGVARTNRNPAALCQPTNVAEKPSMHQYQNWASRRGRPLCRSHEVTVEWDDLIRDLDRMQEATIIKKDCMRATTRMLVSEQVGRVFRRHCPAAKSGVNAPSDRSAPKCSDYTRRPRRNPLTYRILCKRAVEVGHN